MNISKKVVVAGLVLSFPTMLLFQNCANKNSSLSSDVNVSSKLGPVDSNTLPLNQEITIDENNVPKESSSAEPEDPNPQVEYQVIDREVERQENISEAMDLCQQALSNHVQSESQTNLSAPPVISGVRGTKFISPHDIGGATKIGRIMNSYGKIVLCGVEVDKVESSGGGLILISSKVNQVLSFRGHIDLVDGSAVIENSRVKVFRTSLNPGP